MNLHGANQLADSVRTVRKNTILIAEDIPEKDYGYRPTPESRSVAETLLHIAWLAEADRRLHGEKHLSSLEGYDFGALLKESETEEKRPRSKSQIVDLLRTEGERWCDWVSTFPVAFIEVNLRILFCC